MSTIKQIISKIDKFASTMKVVEYGNTVLNIKTPFEIICGDPEAPEGTPENKGAIQVLWELFGGETNLAGYRQLDSHIGLIYGDSITLSLARKINARLKEMGFASTNWVAGIGSYTYQFNTRDTFGFAMKATFGVVNDTGREIFKDPKTNEKKFSKKSAKGLLAVFRVNLDGYSEQKSYRQEFLLKENATWEDVNNCAFEEVFNNGKIEFKNSLSEIRERVAR